MSGTIGSNGQSALKRVALESKSEVGPKLLRPWMEERIVLARWKRQGHATLNCAQVNAENVTNLNCW